MYPANFFNLFPAFPRDNKVFVAMSFAPAFDMRWKNVIAPAIKRVEIGGEALEPYRVDTRQVSDSILTEILMGISQSRLILADITTLGHLDGRAFRNGNVMYEIGIAHAVRAPEEILLFRSDKDHLLFDVSNVRVNMYSPDEEPAESIEIVAVAIFEALKEVDLKRNLAIKAAGDMLDYKSWEILLQASSTGVVSPPPTQTARQALGNAAYLAAISKLLELGALSTSYLKISPELVSSLTDQDQLGESILRYHLTPFGKALLEHVVTRMGVLEPGVRESLEQAFGQLLGR